MPQHAKRIKVRRKDLRKPDEFETLTGQAVDWVQDHRSIVGGVVAVLLVVALGFLGVSRFRAGRNQAAATAFQTAHATFQAGKYLEAAQVFSEVGDTYPGAPFGRLAKLYRAHALARQNDHSSAAIAYTEYLATSPDAEYLRQEALVGLGRAEEAGGQAREALEAYTEAGALAGPYRTDALLAAARLHEAAGAPEKAREIYASLVKDAADADTKALLTAKLPPGSQPAPTQVEEETDEQ